MDEQGKYVRIVAYYSKRCYNAAVLFMGGEREAPKSRDTQLHAEQPQLEAADGGRFQWPEATGTQEVSIFLDVVGRMNVLEREKEMKAERNRQAARKSAKKRYHEELQKDPVGFRAEQAAKKRAYRERKQQEESQEQSHSDTRADNSG